MGIRQIFFPVTGPPSETPEPPNVEVLELPLNNKKLLLLVFKISFSSASFHLILLRCNHVFLKVFNYLL